MILKVVSAKEMARAEKLSYDAGFSEKVFMQKAGEAVFLAAMKLLKKEKLQSVTILAGKGNNAGDGYVAAIEFFKKQIPVQVFQLFDFQDTSTLCAEYGKAFAKMGGQIHFLSDLHELNFQKKTLIIDAMLGTGFKGELKSPFLEVIQKANVSVSPILAVDVPSGLDANHGHVKTSAIKAHTTVFLGLLKIGFFIEEGFDHVGKLEYGDFGFPEEYAEKAEGLGLYLSSEEFIKLVPKVKRTQHKYQAGYAIGVGGSYSMGGAIKLSGLAALRTGAGIVRVFYPKEAESEMKNAPFELIREEFNEKSFSKELKRAGSVFLGPGIGREKNAEEILNSILPIIDKPCVIDADALYFLAKNPDVHFPKHTILTPHHQEMKRFFKNPEKGGLLFLKQVQDFVEEKGVIVILKGAPTWVFVKGSLPYVIARGDPGMATAGTGDVLTGMIGALLAEGVACLEAALLGVYVHALSGEAVSKKKTSFGLIASDLIEEVPKVLKRMIK